jgi:hypothetical protein
VKVLIACEQSGTVREAFKVRGHNAWSCDLLPGDIPGQHFQCDVFDVLYYDWDLIIAHPPCTFLTVAGNRWFGPEWKDRYPERERDREKGKEFFMKVVNAPCKRIAVEQPVSIMSTFYRKPDQIIQPYQFGHDMRKTTCLFLKGLPLLKPTNIVEPAFVISAGKKYSKSHYETWNLPKSVRAKIRSKTFQGIAEAMADQWGSLV